ncbi:MAG: FAD:protein FMN transferase [Helicobacteraceae bacterium]|nr:FAD:protein FMN transferase [Helicobacteraceae bacterium]
MAWFEKALRAKVMSTTILIRANVPKAKLFQAYKIAQDFEERYSAYRKDSFLSQINANAGVRRVACKQEDHEFFTRALEACKLSEGVFDITIGALSHGAYHFGFANESQASQEELSKQKKLVDYREIDINQDGIFLKKKGMRLDVGGIGKGYVAKKIILFLQECGATKALVDVGGEIVCFGKNYTIALKDPFSNGNIGVIKSSKEPLSIATSGDYERFIGSRQNHHILDKKSGASSNFYSSLSVIQNGFDIDMLDVFATALFNQSLPHLKKSIVKQKFAMVTIDKEATLSLWNLKALQIEKMEFSSFS